MTIVYARPEASDFESMQGLGARGFIVQDEPRVSTVEVERRRASDWRPDVIRKLADFLERDPELQPETARWVARWVAGLPSVLPQPFIAVGDDGTVGFEWDVSDCHFHVSFYADESEGHFFTDSGHEEEYEDLFRQEYAVRRAFIRLMSAALGG